MHDPYRITAGWTKTVSILIFFDPFWPFGARKKREMRLPSPRVFPPVRTAGLSAACAFQRAPAPPALSHMRTGSGTGAKQAR
jgi:hypothetical protein